MVIGDRKLLHFFAQNLEDDKRIFCVYSSAVDNFKVSIWYKWVSVHYKSCTRDSVLWYNDAAYIITFTFLHCLVPPFENLYIAILMPLPSKYRFRMSHYAARFLERKSYPVWPLPPWATALTPKLLLYPFHTGVWLKNSCTCWSTSHSPVCLSHYPPHIPLQMEFAEAMYGIPFPCEGPWPVSLPYMAALYLWPE